MKKKPRPMKSKAAAVRNAPKVRSSRKRPVGEVRRPSALRALAEQTAPALQKLVQRQDVVPLLRTMLAKGVPEGGQLPAKARAALDAKIASALKKADWDCFWSNFYSKILKPAVYGFKELGPVKNQQGDVSQVFNGGEPNAQDHDITFEITNLNPQQSHEGRLFDTLHCEITPCNREDLKDLIEALKTRQPPFRVSLDGTLSFDPAHAGDSEKLEVHPIVAARVLS